MNMKLRNIPFSPPDMTEAEAKEVREAILSGWITTGPRTKKLEKLISEYVHTDKTVCLNSATAALGFDIKDYPNAFRLFENEVTLPLHTRLMDEDVEYVIGNFVDIISK